MLLTYAQAARRLGVSKPTLKSSWIATGWPKPSPYRSGLTKYLRLADVDRAASLRLRNANRQLLDLPGAASYLGIGVARLRRLVLDGTLREAMPGHGLYARADLDRILLHLNGIDDPISKAEAARLAGMSPHNLDWHIGSSRLTTVTTGGHYRALSRRAVKRFAAARQRQKQQLADGLRAGKHLRTAEAARRLGISEAALYKAFNRGAIRPLVFDALRRTVVAAAEVRRARAGMTRPVAKRGRGTPAWRRETGLQPGLLTTAQVAELLGVSTKSVLSRVHGGRLKAAGRGKWGQKAAYGFEPAVVRALVDARRCR